MAYPGRVVLRLPLVKSWALEEFVEACLRDGVALICVVGPGCAEMEDTVDELIVGDGSDDSRFIVTTSHPDESIEEVVEFASTWSEAPPGIRIVSF